MSCWWLVDMGDSYLLLNICVSYGNETMESM